ncbi:ComEC/Rec2 family competence protein [Paraliobacillus ryukyuensis]|uniref:ComEC/Rec2 family competence protein n=1 Tax=Paraliobacillus ryukyuensis TaxID=200904 RepID=UPI0009A70F0E|nr:hypothetical protein [Paraliobacillus ryukyuensis]
MKQKIKSFIIVLSIILCFPLPAIAKTQLPMQEDPQLLLSFFNLPEGEATLIQTTGDENYLINTGSDNSTTELINQLEELGVTKLDSIILSKQTEDYIGNLHYLLDHIAVKNLIVAAKPLNEFSNQVKLQQWEKGEQYNLANHLQFHVFDTSVDGEMTFTIQYGDNSMLYMGFSEQINKDLVIQNSNSKPDIIKVPDFAQNNSPSETLLKAIDPHIGIIFNSSSAKLNPRLVERLNESWIDVYQLKQVGTTIIQMTLTDYEVIS